MSNWTQRDDPRLIQPKALVFGSKRVNVKIFNCFSEVKWCDRVDEIKRNESFRRPVNNTPRRAEDRDLREVTESLTNKQTPRCTFEAI